MANSVNIIIDAHFPRNLVWLFQEFAINAYHTLGMPNKNQTTDSQILDFADMHNAIVMTKDADFVDSFYLQNRPKKLFLVSTGNIKNSELKLLLTNHLKEILTFFEEFNFIELTSSQIIVHQ